MITGHAAQLRSHERLAGALQLRAPRSAGEQSGSSAFQPSLQN